MLQAQSELRYVRGVGPRRADKLGSQGLCTLEDLLYHLPFRYEDRREFARIDQLGVTSAEHTISARVDSSRLIRTRRRGFTIFEAQLSDASGSIKAVWYNQPYLVRVLKAGRHVLLFGRAALNRQRRLVLENPDYELVEEGEGEGIHTGRVVPVYRKAGDFASRALRRVIFGLFEELDTGTLREIVPPEVAERHDLLPRGQALRDAHFPAEGVSLAALEQRTSPAHRTLAFEEIYLIQLALALRRRGLEREERGITYRIPDVLRTRLASLLPFKLTDAQKAVLKEIGADLRSPHPMNRLLQGDVGSGKTIVALLTLLVAVENGYQAALMAPTEILAEQHQRNIRKLLAPGEIECRIGLLTGSQRTAARRALLSELAHGECQLVIGTHALFEAGVRFKRLGLAVVDEQHRFGVLQRAALAGKGPRPDVLVMTATPIPRSLALTMYGDMDLSVIDELPPGRTPVRTVVRREGERAKVYDGLRQELGRGRQAYVVVPLVEETARSDLKAATGVAEHLRDDVFPEFQVGLLHGRMKGPEKDAVMQAFTRGEIHVLVATTVIEVGVDVPNAAVMIVEHAERFGLSQLHQLRGRVGRGGGRSYCVLMVGSEDHGKDARERLAIMEQSNDGFRIAQKDLDIRGPGAVYGTQQHGLGDLQFLSVILGDPDLVEAARGEAQQLAGNDRDSEARAQKILDGLGSRWQKRLGLRRVG